MERRRGGANDFFGFGDPFAGFGGPGRPGSLMPSFFGGRDPFDHPFFNSPFGGMMGPSMFGQNMLGPGLFGSRGSPFGEFGNPGPNMLGPGLFGSRGSPFGEFGNPGPNMLGPGLFGSRGSPFGEFGNPGFLEQAPPTNVSRGPIIQELDSDAEEEEKDDNEGKQNPRKHTRSSKEPYVQDPDEEAEEKRSRHMQLRGDSSRINATQPQSRTFTFQSSSVTYGGANGAYYTSSTTRRTRGDGVTVEESREADTTSGKATHRISRGLHNKGHTVTRKLNSDGRVDTVQTLHNLNQDELPAFEQTWKGNARQRLPGWNPGADMPETGRIGSRSNTRPEQARGRALPSNNPQESRGRNVIID